MPDTAFQTDDSRLNSLTLADVRSALVQHNPTVPSANVQALAQLIADVSTALAQLPLDELRRIAAGRKEKRLREAIRRVAGKDERADERAIAAVSAEVETSQGAGFGEIVELEAGRKLVDEYAIARPMETWAGRVAGAGVIEGELGIARSTLNQWQKRGSVIGLLRGERKLAYPLEQFVDARPLEGLADVLRAARDPRVAWLWMRQPHGALGDITPLQALKEGRSELVRRVAERDFV